MKRATIVLMVIALGITALLVLKLSSSHSRSASIGQTARSKGETAPDFALESVEGGIVHLSDFHGKAVLVHFWATSWLPCRVEMQWFEQMHSQYGPQGLQVLGVAMENGVTVGCGTVFKMTPAGTLTTLHSFDDTDGSFPSAGLVQGTDGNLYGTTSGGGTGTACGTRGCGTIFKITPGGMLTTLHSFDYTDGDEPVAGLVQATDGNIYGTTALGGPTCGGGHGCGTVFKITTGGKLTTLYTFCSKTNCTDGEVPFAGLVQATDGNFYGTTNAGGTGTACGTSGCGTVFKITPGGMLTTLHSFDSTDGYGPTAGPVEGTNGNFYGTTDFGGVNGDGTIFSLSVGLGPFVETLPTSGKVGTHVIILGNNLTGSTRVTFNGTAATFTVVSSTEIKTTVPSGATTGKVKVTTPTRTLTSNMNFRVTN